MSSPASAQAKQHVNSGLNYLNQKQYVLALQEFDNAIQLDPNDAQAFYNRGLAHLEMRSYAQAENDFNVASRLKPEYAAPLDALAQLHLRIALETLERAYYLCQVNPTIHPQYLVNEISRRIDALKQLLPSK